MLRSLVGSEMCIRDRHVYSEQGLDPGDLVTLECLAGGLARSAPSMYRVPTTPHGADPYALWLREMVSSFGGVANTSYLDAPLPGLVHEHRSSLTGVVRFNMSDGSVNAAITFVAGQAPHELLLAASPPATLTLLAGLGLPVVWDATARNGGDAYAARGVSAFNPRMVSFQTTGQSSNLAEYAIFARAPTVQYSCGNPSATTGCDMVVSQMSLNPNQTKVALGWGPEADYVTHLSAAGIYVHAPWG
eukprot:TRINITY_DN13378_c0_g1_i2.p1 TRINITY_DN13378_c0_g1~~TRINITY_DN13378_c0_g1_i2.p1  ORF type:complete len:246 (-),score=56.57 TRINITY_DN13378_c0_g1_i2:212-949(-)